MTTLYESNLKRAQGIADKLKEEIADSKSLAQYAQATVSKQDGRRPFSDTRRRYQVADLVKRNVSWVYACAKKNGASVASTPLKLYATTSVGEKDIRSPHRKLKDSEVTKLLERGRIKAGELRTATSVSEIFSHPFLDMMADVNPWRQQFDTFSESQQYLDLTGDTYWYLTFDPVLGIPTQFFVLPSQWTSVVPDRNKWIAGYEFGRTREDALFLQPREVLQFRNANPMNQFNGMSCLEASLDMHDLTRAMNASEMALNRNGARPSFIAAYDTKLNRKQRRENESMMNRIFAGNQNTGKIVVSDKTFELKQVSLPPRDMQYLEGRKWSKTEICAMFDIPESMMSAEGSNRASSLTAMENYARYGVFPRLQLFEQTMNQQLIPLYNEPRIFCAFDSPIPEDLAFQLERAVNLYQGGLTTRNESREMQGLAPATDGGDEFKADPQPMNNNEDETSRPQNSDGVANDNANA